jgi:hypothetical protein
VILYVHYILFLIQCFSLYATREWIFFFMTQRCIFAFTKYLFQDYQQLCILDSRQAVSVKFYIKYCRMVAGQRRSEILETCIHGGVN